MLSDEATSDTAPADNPPANDRPWQTSARREIVVDLLVVAAITGAWRATLLAISRAPLFFHDSGTYIGNMADLRPLWDRPPGASAIWRVAVEIANSPMSILVTQAFAGVISACLVYGSARLLGISRLWSVLGSVATGASLSHAFFERMLMAEALGTLGVMLVTFVLLACLRWRRWWLWLGLGVALGASVLVRLQMTTVMIAACAAIVALWWEARWVSRLRGALLMVVTAAIPIVIYSLALGATERTVWPDAANAPSYLDGQLFLTKVSSFLDCPGRYSEQQLADDLCTQGRDFLSDPNRMLWGGKGPLVEMREQIGPSATDAKATSLAVEILADHPYAYFAKVTDAIHDSLFIADDDEPDGFVDDPRSLGPWIGESYARQFGISLESYPVPARDEARFWYAMDVRWNYFRILAWAGVAVTLFLTLGPWSRNVPGRDGARVLSGTLAMTVLGVSMTSEIIVPRYWYPFENVAWLLTGWAILAVIHIASGRAARV